MMIAAAINSRYHKVSASLLASWWNRSAERAKRKMDDDAYPEDYLYDLTPHERAYQERLGFKRDLARLQRDSRLVFLDKLKGYVPSKDNGRRFLSILVLEDRASRLQEKVDIYKKWIEMEANLLWRGGPTDFEEVRENLDKALLSLENIKVKLAELKKEFEENNPGFLAEMVGEVSKGSKDQ